MPAGEPPVFTDAEYRRRWRAVMDALPAHGVDAIAVTYELHIEYLTATTGSQFWVAPVMLVPGSDPVFLVREFELDKVRAVGRVADVVTYLDRSDAIEQWAGELRRLGLERARLGLELDNLDLTYHDVIELRRLLPEMQVVDVSHLVPRVMAVKSAEELAVMETAARRTRIAIETFTGALAPGVSEEEVRERMRTAVMADGSEDLRGSVAFGLHSAVPHAEAGGIRLAAGDVAITETSGYHLGYCATLCRTAVLGQAEPAVWSLYDLARTALEAAMDTIRPGATAGEVDAAARDVIGRAGRAGSFRHRTGYSVGLRANGRLNISLQPGAEDVIEQDMTFHMPIILFEPGRFSVGCSESVVVTEDGCRALCDLPRDLIVVSG
jgi:Xaa-Pro aminopeptidase